MQCWILKCNKIRGSTIKSFMQSCKVWKDQKLNNWNIYPWISFCDLNYIWMLFPYSNLPWQQPPSLTVSALYVRFKWWRSIAYIGARSANQLVRLCHSCQLELGCRQLYSKKQSSRQKPVCTQGAWTWNVIK